MLRRRSAEAVGEASVGDAVVTARLPYLDRELLFAMDAALAVLPRQTRVVFVLRRVEDLSYAEIATRMRISVDKVEHHMLAATCHLIARLGDLDATGRGTAPAQLTGRNLR